MKVPLLHRANEHSTAHAKILFVTLFCSLAFFVIISSLDSLRKGAVPSTETSLGMEPFRRDISQSSSEGTGSFPNTVANSPAVETDMRPFGNQNVAPESPAYSPNSLSILRAAAMVLQDAEPEDYSLQESNEIPGNAVPSQPGPSSRYKEAYTILSYNGTILHSVLARKKRCIFDRHVLLPTCF